MLNGYCFLMVFRLLISITTHQGQTPPIHLFCRQRTHFTVHQTMTYNSGQDLNNNELRNEKDQIEVKETREREVLSRDELHTALIFHFDSSIPCKKNALAILGSEKFENLKSILYELHLNDFQLVYSFRVMEFSKDGGQLTR